MNGVRVTRAYAEADIAASIYPGVAAITYPGAESRLEIEQLEAQIARQERLRGIRPGVIAIEATIRTAAGVVHAGDLAARSGRLQTLVVEQTWLSVHLGIDDADDSAAVQYAVAECELSARENDLALGDRETWSAAVSIPERSARKATFPPARRRTAWPVRQLRRAAAAGRGYAVNSKGATTPAEREAP